MLLFFIVCDKKANFRHIHRRKIGTKSTLFVRVKLRQYKKNVKNQSQILYLNHTNNLFKSIHHHLLRINNNAATHLLQASLQTQYRHANLQATGKRVPANRKPAKYYVRRGHRK